MKKTIVTAVAVLLIASVIAPVCACASRAKKELANYMTITGVTQHADGSVYATLDFGETDFTKDDYYNLQFSIDGGETWAKYSSMQFNKEYQTDTVPVIIYANERYYFGNTGFEDNIIEVTAGEVLQVTMRFMGDEVYKASEPTNTVNYTMKNPSPAGAGVPKIELYALRYEWTAVGGKTYDYAFEAQPDNSFKLKRLTYTADEDNDDVIIITDLLESDYGLFEYKFYTGLTAEEKDEYVYNKQWGKNENEKITDGWTDYNHETGILPSAYSSRMAKVYRTEQTFDMDNNLISETRVWCNMAIILVRYKGTDSALRSVVLPVELSLTELWNSV